MTKYHDSKTFINEINTSFKNDHRLTKYDKSLTPIIHDNNDNKLTTVNIKI